MAYPSFDDYYEEGGLEGALEWDIPYADGDTLFHVLQRALQNQDNLDFLQLATWNDFGEGTMFEPTLEYGFDPLLQVQDFTGVSYDAQELQLIVDLYVARKTYSNDLQVQIVLDDVSSLLADLRVDEARATLATIPEPGMAAMLVALTTFGSFRRRRQTCPM